MEQDTVSIAEANLAAVIENADGLVYSIDRDFRYITLNNAIKKRIRDLFGVEVKAGDKIYGLLENVDPSGAREWHDIYTRAFRGEALKFVKEFTYSGTSQFWTFSINPIKQKGEVTGLACFARDITEKRKSESLLRESEERYRLVSENPILGVGWASFEGKILYVNQTFCSLLEYTPTELNDIHFGEITHPDDAEWEFPLFERLVKGEIDNYKVEKRYITKTGKLIWVELNLTKVKNHDGFEYCIGIIQNISLRKQAEESLLRINDELEERVKYRTAELRTANEELEAFSYSVSHDLRNPVKNIKGFCSLLIKNLTGKISADEQLCLKTIYESASNMGVLIEDILRLSRSGRVALTKRNVNMNDVVSTVLAELKPTDSGHIADISIEGLPNAICDPVMIKQVWYNLISNALKYSSKRNEPRVTIGVRIIADKVAYYIKDNGAGFDMKNALRLFNVFQRLHSDADFEGNGIGLAIVNRIVTKHGGKVWAEAEVDKGATFYFTLN
ncbi:MAG TPA: PAS domain S-box protein [Chitinophagales bacterium]|nr:PAS domain S-box protein [Chitinophagales bacterium]